MDELVSVIVPIYKKTRYIGKMSEIYSCSGL